MPLNFDDLQRRADAELAAPRRVTLGPTSAQQDPEQERNLTLAQAAGDVLMAPVRGIEGAAQDVYGLLDTITLDALPDWEQRFFGTSRTRVGGVIEGISNFAAGFIPVYGWLGKAAKAGRWLSAPVRGAVAGAIADFAVFDGHEERLSNLVQQFPALRNPVSEYLASDKDDPEIVGRLKNSLEGLGIGLLTDAALLSLKALKAGRKARAAGLSAEEVEVAVDRAVPPDELGVALRKAEALPEAEVAEEVAEVTAGAKALDQAAPSEPEAVLAGAKAPEVKAPEAPAAPAPTGDGATVEILRSFDIDEGRAKGLLALARRQQAAEYQGGAVNPRAMTEAERFSLGLQQTDLNMSRYHGPEGAIQLLRAMEHMLEPLHHYGKESATTLAKREAEGLATLADIVQENNPHRLLAVMQKDLPDLKAINRRILAYKTGTLTYANYVASRAKLLAKPGAATDATRAEFRVALGTLAEMELAVKGLLGEQSRGLGQNRIGTRVAPFLWDDKALQDAIAAGGGHRRIDELAAKFLVVHEKAGAAGAVDLARATAGRRTWAVLNEYWYNSLLGRPTTLVVNGMSSLLTTIYRPLELMLGGALTGQSHVVREAAAEISALVQSVPEALQGAAASLRAGGSLWDPRATVIDLVDTSRAAITAGTFGLADDSLLGAATNWVGRLVRMPSKALQTTDNFVKELNYRAVSRSQLLKDALAKGLSPEDTARSVQQGLDRLIFEGQAYGSAQLYHRGVQDALKKGVKSRDLVDAHARQYAEAAAQSGEHQRLSAIAALAKERAEEVTFTKPLRYGSVEWKMQQAVRDHWYLRLVMPFVRTPVNIAGFTMQRLDVPGAVRVIGGKRFPGGSALESARSRLVQDMLSGDGRRKADAIGRLAAGMSITAWVVHKAGQFQDGLPLISGRGPADKEQRQALEAAGWQPYSIRVGDKYVSYARLDPFASMLGIAADMQNYVRYASDEDQNAVEDLSYSFAVSLASNFVNKTYLSGLANLVEALEDPVNKVPRVINTLGASFVPGQAAAVVSVVDPVFRDVQSLMDAARARWPGASDDLPPRRNVLGEPFTRAAALGGGTAPILNAIVPVQYREVSDDVLNKEFAALGHGFTQPRRVFHGIDLTQVRNKAGQNAYDRWSELHGEIKLGGQTLRQSLRRLVQSDRYKRIPVESTDAIESPRIQLIQNVIDDYRQAALRRTLVEYPELGALERDRVRQSAALKRGQETRPALVRALQGGR